MMTQKSLLPYVATAAFAVCSVLVTPVFAYGESHSQANASRLLSGEGGMNLALSYHGGHCERCEHRHRHHRHHHDHDRDRHRDHDRDHGHRHHHKHHHHHHPHHNY